MKDSQKAIGSFLLVLCLLGPLTVVNAQISDNGWLRISTDEDSVTEIDRESLVLGPSYLVSAKYRNVLSAMKPVPGVSGVQYKTRLDTIQFDTQTFSYRISESVFLDGSDKPVWSFANDDLKAGWRRLRSGSARKLFSAASQLRPFGRWKVVSYRYATGEGPASDDPPELRQLIGRHIILGLDQLFVGNSNCPGSTVQAQSISDSEMFKKFGTTFKDLDIPSDTVNVMRMECSVANREYPPYVLVLLQTPTKAKFLWNGVFLDIERPGNLFLP